MTCLSPGRSDRFFNSEPALTSEVLFPRGFALLTTSGAADPCGSTTLVLRGLAVLLQARQGHRPAAEGSELVGTVAVVCSRQAWAKLVWWEIELLCLGCACLPGPAAPEVAFAVWQHEGAPESAEHLLGLGRWEAGFQCCLRWPFPGGSAEDAARSESL